MASLCSCQVTHLVHRPQQPRRLRHHFRIIDDPLPPFLGFLALLALAIYTGVTVTFFGKRFLDWRFSWSYIIGWVAIILAFAAGIINSFAK